MDDCLGVPCSVDFCLLFSFFIIYIFNIVIKLFYFYFLLFDSILVYYFYINTLSYIVFRMAQSEPSSGVKGKAIYNKNLSN